MSQNKIKIEDLSATGIPDETTFLRGDNTFAVPEAPVTPGGNDYNVQVNIGGVLEGYDVFKYEPISGQFQIGVDNDFTEDPQTPVYVTSDINNFSQINFKNVNDGDTASTDFVLSADNDGVGAVGHFINMGISGSNWSSVDYGAIATVAIANGGIDYTEGDIVSLDTGDGNATVEVLAVSGGVVTDIGIVTNGTGYIVEVDVPTIGGTGTGLLIDVDSLIDLSLDTPNRGYLYVSGGDISIGTDSGVVGKKIQFHTSGFSTANLRMEITDTGIGVGGVTSPSARLHLPAGTAVSGTAPLKFTSGALNTSRGAGAVEFLTDKLYLVITTGTARKEFTLNDTALTSGRIPYTTTSGRLTNSSNLLFDGTDMTALGDIFLSGDLSSSGARVANGYFTNLNVGSSGTLTFTSSGGKRITITQATISFNDDTGPAKINLVGENMLSEDSNKTITLPNKTGTVALTSDLNITTGYTVSGLPAGTEGMRAHVTDASAPTFGSTVTGGGSVVIPVFYNGSAWIVG